MSYVQRYFYYFALTLKFPLNKDMAFDLNNLEF